jgi:adenylyltransferase/sulfurtransferase
MHLSDAQIDRYSRQIIVPRVGGRAQERILAARIVLVAQEPDLELVLAYLVGAGVGRIELECGSTVRADKLGAAMFSLNSDSTVRAFISNDAPRGVPDLVFAIIGGAGTRTSARTVCAGFVRVPSVVARLDSPARIGIFPAPPPCALCAGDLLVRDFGARADEAGVIAAAATTEVFKLLARYDATPRAAIIEFDGCASNAREPAPNPNCACAGQPA